MDEDDGGVVKGSGMRNQGRGRGVRVYKVEGGGVCHATSSPRSEDALAALQEVEARVGSVVDGGGALLPVATQLNANTRRRRHHVVSLWRSPHNQCRV